jgi:hypothetical protein
MTQLSTSEKMKCSVAIDLNNSLCGCLEVQKTHFEISIDDLHYTIFVPTSAVPREDIKDVTLSTIAYSSLSEELFEVDDNGTTVERTPLIKIGEDYYYCKQGFSNISMKNGKNLFLLKPTTQLPPILGAQISLSVSKNF